MSPVPDRWAASNPNSLAAWVAGETMFRAGVGFVAVCPGSRSTPLAIAFARQPGLEVASVLDERSAGFLALGHARRTGRPAAVVCTSGTAAANFLPAVVEAREGRVPLLVLTADRPPEMRSCASGQAIRQVGIFGVHALEAMDLPVPGEADLAGLLACWRQWFAFAAERSVRPQPGPVHLNLPFRDPLPPDPEGPGVAASLQPCWDGFFAQVSPPERPGRAVASPAPQALPDLDGRGVIVAGWQPAAAEESAAHGRLLATVARATGWPVLADGINDFRGRSGSLPGIVRAYDILLRDPALAARLRPTAVLQVGGLPTSKVLRAWLAGHRVPTWVADDGLDRLDPLGVPSRRVPGGLAGLAAALAGREAAPSAWWRGWLEADARASALLDAALAASPAATEPRVARAVLETVPAGTLLVVANSMPVRDFEWFRPVDSRGVRVVVNRGANGIDGTLSTALGVAWGAAAPAVLLSGDLAFLHDSNGLLLARALRGSLTVVVVDNRGGGIFNHLPVARLDPPFERLFATPQEVDIPALVAAHGLSCRVVEGEAALRAALAEGVGAPGARVILWKADRRADAAWRKSTFASAGTALAAGSS